MRAVVGVFYWFVVGMLALFAFYVSVAGNSPWSGLLIPAGLAFVGAWWPGLRYSGAALIAFGMYPALLVTGSVLGQVVNTNWSCSKVAFDGISNPHGGSSGCTVVSIDLILFGLGMWIVALLGALVLYRWPRYGDA
jgi:hypothetical protein